MSKPIRSQNPVFVALLKEILDAGAVAGMSHAQMAQRVGITPETLSRMKSRGNGDFDVLEKLSKLVGKRLILIADDSTQAAIRRGEFF